MNLVDAICLICGQEFQWLTGGPRWCASCCAEKQYKRYAEAASGRPIAEKPDEKKNQDLSPTMPECG